MKFKLLKAVASLVTVGAFLVPAVSSAQAFPNRPVTIIVPFQAGGFVDAIARELGLKLSKAWGQPVIIDNRPGANGLIATQALMKAQPDGHTLLYHLTGIIQNPLLSKSAATAYDPLKDITPVIQLGGQVMGLAVPAKSDINSVDQLVADGKAKGAKGHTYGTVGVGHTGHIWSELLVTQKGFKGADVPYKGASPLLLDLVADRVDWAFLGSSDAVVRSADKSVKVLAVTGPERLKQLPSIPTMRELGYPGFEMVGWHGLFAPANTPKAVVTKIENDVRTAMQDPEIRKAFETHVITTTEIGSDEFRKVMVDDQGRWAALIKKFNIQID
jgi:tripartite-type tricarboxylate transporter receptor subunit TctC